jgi:hypothetical protein
MKTETSLFQNTVLSLYDGQCPQTQWFWVLYTTVTNLYIQLFFYARNTKWLQNIALFTLWLSYLWELLCFWIHFIIMASYDVTCLTFQIILYPRFFLDFNCCTMEPQFCLLFPTITTNSCHGSEFIMPLLCCFFLLMKYISIVMPSEIRCYVKWQKFILEECTHIDRTVRCCTTVVA